MDLMIIVAAAILAWVIGSLWYRITARAHDSAARVQVRNVGDPRQVSMMPYIGSGLALVAVVAMMRAVFIRMGIAGFSQGLVWGAGIGAFLVAPWFLITNDSRRRPVGLSVIDGGYAVLACAAVGAVLGSI